MKVYSSDRIRNVLLAGHNGTGKTTLGEALLSVSGATNRIGRVEDGTTVLDFDDEEKAKGMSVSLAVAPVEWRDTKINLLDAPGYADFIGEVQAGLSVADLVCLVVSAVDGPEVQHDVVWHMAAEAAKPRIIFVNKCDRERASVPRTLAALAERFGPSVAPLQLPLGEEHDFAGVVDLLTDRAYRYADADASEEDIPEGVAAAAGELRAKLVEAIVETDEDLMERYFADEPIDPKELVAALGSGVAAGSVHPVLCGAAGKLIGIDRLADFVVDACPSPLDRPGMPTSDGETVTPRADGPPAAYVYKTFADPFVGKISYLRVASGAIRPDVQLQNARTGKDERLHQLFVLKGKEHETAGELAYGDLGAVAKLPDVGTGDTLAQKGSGIVVAPPAPPEPVLAVAIAPKTKEAEDKLATALHRLQDEDLSLKVERNPETHQTLLWGMGETHLNIALERMKRKSGVEVETAEPRVAYRETARKRADFEGKHKKQSGGRGQFGVAHVVLEPLPRGGGFEFVDAVVGGAIPKGFLPAIQKGMHEAMARGVLAGCPIVDIKVTVDDGKHHAVDSDEFSFKMAGSLALQGAFLNADPVVLEPIGFVEVLVPDALAGDVSGDLNSKRGRLQGMDSVGRGRTLIRAMAPMAEMTRYAIDLRSLTGGRGSFRIEFDHYEELPPHIADKIIAARKAEKEAQRS